MAKRHQKLRLRVHKSHSFYSSVLYPYFYSLEKGYINIVPKDGRSRMPPSVRASVAFLVIVSSPKPLDIATSN